MNVNRFLNVILYSGIASTAAYGVYSLIKSESSTVVKIKATRSQINGPTILTSYPLLAGRLTKDDLPPAIFTVAIYKQRNELTREQVFELANLALKKQRVVHLDMLAGYFPDIITPAWVNEAIIHSKNRFVYSHLLHEAADGKIKNLNYLFHPDNEVVVIEERDDAGIKEAVRLAKARKIILVDTEYYDPSYKYHT